MPEKGIPSVMPLATAAVLTAPPPTAIGLRGPYSGHPPLAPNGNQSLRVLDISGNEGITAESGRVLASLVGVHEDERAPVPASHLRRLDAAWCPLGTQGCEPIIAALRLPPQRLTQLDLSFTGMEDGVADELLRALCENGSLERLDISHNRLGPRAAASVAEGLLANRTLKILLMGFNPLGFQGTMKVALACHSNKLLDEIGLENTCGGGTGPPGGGGASRAHPPSTSTRGAEKGNGGGKSKENK